MVRLSIDQKKCAGCDLCGSYAPNLFKLDLKHFKAKLKQKGKLVDVLSIDLTSKQLKEIKEIIRSCPSQAIKLSK